MDSRDEVISNHNDNINNNNSNVVGQSSIVKGKRTKRQRPQSPIPFRMISPNNSTKSDGGSDLCSNNIMTDEIIPKTTTLLEEEEDAYYLGMGTTTTTTTTTTTMSTNEEEEEMANCLILLAQGHSRYMDEHVKSQKRASLSLFDNDNLQVNNSHFQPHTTTNTKFTSRKFMETPTTTGKSGYYVYECKTCSKTFPSFQALGGHRASHRKPKNNKDDDLNIKVNNRLSNTNLLSLISSSNNNNNTNNNLLISSDEEDPPFKSSFKHNISSSSLSLQLTNRALYNDKHNISGSSNNKARVHECSICGAEFSSGQALGGHMRRHRGSVHGASITAMPISAVASAVAMENERLRTYTTEQVMQEVVVHMSNNNNRQLNNMQVNNSIGSTLNLDLDLNLPAPSEDHHVLENQTESEFVFASKQPEQYDQQTSLPQQNHPPQQQQQQLVLSSPALVDCHY